MATMLPDGRRIGAHMALAAGMVKACERAATIGASTIQIFTDNPAAWKRRAEPPAELEAFRARLSELDIAPVSIHAPYLVNLAGPPGQTFERSVELLGHELAGAHTFASRFVNVHIGSHLGLGVAAGIERLTAGILRALALADAKAGRPADAMLVLENSAGSGGALGLDIDELAAISAAVDAAGVPRERVGFCLDSAHAWAAGVDVGDPVAIDAFLDAFDARIGLDRLVLVHLNDSRSERGSRLDRHEHVGAGRIGQAGLGHLLRHPGLLHAAYLLETPGMDEGYDAINLDRARDLWAGLALSPLPSEAFELRGSARARTAPA
jgi:deoxyribonuclease-4